MPLTEVETAALRRLEESLWRPETRYDLAYMEGLLAADFFEFGRSGRTYTRAETLEISAVVFEAVIPLPDFRVRLLSAEVAQVTYVSVVRYGEEVLYGRRSSLWSRAENGFGWELRFHQGTPFEGGAATAIAAE